jgi:hypothetical protein
VSLRLTDDDAATSTATFDVHAHGWKIVTADTPSAQGGYAVNLLLQNGNPVILHTTLSGYGVRLVRSTTAVGDSAADWTGATVLDGTHAPTHASFALIGGNPACTFFADNVPNGLFYSRSTTASGMSSADWLAPVQLDVSDLPGLGSSLLEVNGKPAVAYGANSTGDLRYAYSSTSDGASGWTSLTVDGDGAGGKSVGSFMSLAIVSGCPAIVYSSQTAPIGLLYIKSTTAGGTALADWTGGTHTTINTDSSQNGYPSLLLVGGFPATPFIDSAGTLRYARSTSATGGAAWTLSTVDSAGEYLSMAIIGGKPAVAYHNATTDRARYVSSSTADGNGDAAWTNEADVTTSGSNGRFAALTALASGQPAMAYRDDGNGVLKYGVLY